MTLKILSSRPMMMSHLGQVSTLPVTTSTLPCGLSASQIQAVFSQAGLAANQIAWANASNTSMNECSIATGILAMLSAGATPTQIQAQLEVAGVPPAVQVGSTSGSACTDSIGCLSIGGKQIPETPLLIAAALTLLAFMVMR